MLLAFAVAPTTTSSAEGAVTSAVARAVKIVRESGLPYETTSMFTTIEGEWDEVMSVVKAATDAVAEVSPASPSLSRPISVRVAAMRCTANWNASKARSQSSVDRTIFPLP